MTSGFAGSVSAVASSVKGSSSPLPTLPCTEPASNTATPDALKAEGQAIANGLPYNGADCQARTKGGWPCLRRTRVEYLLPGKERAVPLCASHAPKDWYA